MAGTHRERTEGLEAKFKKMEIELTNADERFNRIDRTLVRLERLITHRGRSLSEKETSSSSSSATDESDVNSERELNPIQMGDQHERNPRDNHGGDDRGRGKPKIFCPTFSGNDPITWLSRVTQYFYLIEIHRKERIRYAAYYLEGEANMWWQWISHVYKKQSKKIRWKDFEKELLSRFGPSDYINYDEALTHIKQTGTLREYQKEFAVASCVKD